VRASTARRGVRRRALAAAGALVAVATGELWRRVRGRRWYDVVYRTCYALGLRIWERAAPAAALVALVEGPAAALRNCRPVGRCDCRPDDRA
jgi:hypothetical protein